MCSMLPAMAKDLVLLYTQLVEKGEMVERKRHDRMRDRGPRLTFFLRMEGLRRKPQSTSKVHSSLSPTRCIFLERSDVMYDGRRRYSKYGIGLSWYVSPLNHC